MKFDFAIGNPCYQKENPDSNRQEPVYHYFIDEAVKIANVTEMITPARFLFDAGQTPKEWNKKMLSDTHFKVLSYEPDASLIFPSTDIKGGVAITTRNNSKEFGPIEVFTSFQMLNNILQTLSKFIPVQSFSTIANSKSSFGLSEQVYLDYPNLIGTFTTGNEYIIDASIFTKMTCLFDDTKKSFDDIAVYGREDNTRVIKYLAKKYIKNSTGVDKYKVLLPGANGNGTFGETLSNPFIGIKNSVHTQTYMNFGYFDNVQDAENCLKYIKTRFLRCLLGVLKVTQNNPKNVWTKIPLQDFSTSSDIDWSTSIKNIDRQLYKKYGLSQEEIDFIESHVKEME